MTPIKEQDPDFTTGSTGITCHVSTLYWLYFCTFEESPSMETLGRMVATDGGISGIINSFLKQAVTFNKDSKYFPENHILIFDHDNEATHSCITITKDEFAGYNQADWIRDTDCKWFKGGRTGVYSQHSIKDIKWDINCRSLDLI